MGGVLLTGGASRRMGRDKATISWNGETLAVRAARVLRAVCDPVVEVGDGVSGLPSVREHPRGAGPLAAVVTGIDALALPEVAVVVLACDLPRVEEPLLRLLVEWPGDRSVVPSAGGRLQYGCARLGTAGAVHGANAHAAGARALATAFDVHCDRLPESVWHAVAPADAFVDVDTPADLDSLGRA